MSESKKKLVIYAWNYRPYPSQNGVCLKNLLENWTNKFDITIIANNQDNGKKYFSENGINYIFVNSFLNRLQNSVRNKNGYFFKLLNKILRILRGIKTAFLWLRYENYYYKGCIKETKKILKNEKIDCILAASYPFSAIYAAYKMHMSNGIKYVTYILDDYCSAKNLRKICICPVKYKEKDRSETIKIMQQANCNFVSEGFIHSDIYKKTVQADIPIKTVGFPLL